MKPRMVAIEGPLKGEIFDLGSTELTFGRDGKNRIILNDASVSRSHCVVAADRDGRYRLTDADSYNGTSVNGLPVKERLLEHGDEIRIGHSVFLFQLSETSAQSGAGTISFEDAPDDSRTVIRLQREDSIYLSPEAAVGLRPTTATAREFGTLLKMSAAIHSAGGLHPLAEQILEILLEAIPAQNGVILIYDGDRDELDSVFSRSRDTGQDAPIGILKQMADRVRREGTAILSNHGQPDGSEKGAGRPSPRSVLAVPLTTREKTLGMIYLDSNDPRVFFSEKHLQLLAAVGLIAGATVEDACAFEKIRRENQRLETELAIEHEMIGESAAAHEIYRFIAKVAPADSTVLILGETGTGKELVARAIHRNSPRACRPFVAINCAALTESMLESELFGHERGAFTGAVVQKKGKLEVANGGTVFLDEVGEFPLPLQARLLRMLQEKEFERVGGTRPIKVDLRILAATNRDLADAVERGAFRRDLYFRLNVVTLRVPPLRERRDDILELAANFAAKLAARSRRSIKGFSDEARSCLVEYSWPGNIRELQNVIESAVVLGTTDVILPEDLPDTLLDASATVSSPPSSFIGTVKQVKRHAILSALEQTGGSVTEAARILKLHPNSLHRLIRNLGLREGPSR